MKLGTARLFFRWERLFIGQRSGGRVATDASPLLGCIDALLPRAPVIALSDSCATFLASNLTNVVDVERNEVSNTFGSPTMLQTNSC